MKLLTKEIIKRFKEVGEQDVEDPIVIAKFFNPNGLGTWYAIQYNEEEKVFFGYVSIFGDSFDEWGSFTLQELEEYRGQLGLGIERDMWFGEKRFSEIKYN